MPAFLVSLSAVYLTHAVLKAIIYDNIENLTYKEIVTYIPDIYNEGGSTPNAV